MLRQQAWCQIGLQIRTARVGHRVQIDADCRHENFCLLLAIREHKVVVRNRNLRDPGLHVGHLVDQTQLHARVTAQGVVPNVRRLDREPRVQFAGLGQGRSVEHVRFVHEKRNPAFELIAQLVAERTRLHDLEMFYHDVVRRDRETRQ